MRFKFFRRSKPRQIKLGDLARAFWQDRPEDKVNSGDQGLPFSDSDPDWKNSDVQNFWIEYVLPFQTTMTSPVFQAVQALLAEIEKLEPCSSVSETDPETPKQYLGLTGISLMDHSLAVAREAVDLLRVRENDFQMVVGKTLIAALAHDVGKHPSASIPNMPHSYRSAVWLQKRIGHLRDREQIVAAVRLHHAETGFRRVATDNPIVPILTRADQIARQKELAAVAVEKQMENPDSNAHDHSPAENDPQSTEANQEEEDTWFSKEKFLEHLRSRITCLGFDSFCFDKRVHFTPAVVESVLNQMRQDHRLPNLISRAEISRIFASWMPEVRNEKYRLRFRDNFTPLKKWFYVFEVSQFESLGEMDHGNPRDHEGRWLKNMDLIEPWHRDVPEPNQFPSGTNNRVTP